LVSMRLVAIGGPPQNLRSIVLTSDCADVPRVRQAPGASEADPPRPRRDGERQALGDQPVRAAGGLAEAVGVQHLRLQAVELVQRPGPRLAQELALLLPEYARGLGGFLQPCAALLKGQRPAQARKVQAHGAHRRGAALALLGGAPQTGL